ncbi:MAG: FAD-dependent oxidoreductase, partial [Candidatus Binatia bacterium]
GAVGGNAGSFEVAGIRVDYGSHRLHPAADPEVLALIRRLLGADLIERPRHGRILLLGRWIHFPLRPLDLALRIPPRFAVGVAADQVRKLVARSPARDGESFAGVLERSLGRTMCEQFYFPFARKIWGLEPAEISAIQAHRRVSAGSVGKLVRRLLPGGSGGGAPRGIFLYPRRGYGEISERLCEAAVACGADVQLRATVSRVRSEPGGCEVEVDREGRRETLRADHVWSTVPVTALVRLLDPPPPAPILEAASSLGTRAMVLVYLVLAQDRFTEFDAHYFPGRDVPFTRISEPKNYAAVEEPRGRTVLCAEIPCATGDALWSRDDAALGELVREGLGRAGLPVRAAVAEVVVRRIANVYPLYRRGYEVAFDRIDDWLGAIDGLLTFGRQGLFVHDNTHHALYMALAAVRCLRSDGRFDREAWSRYRDVFATHVVED